MPEYTHRKTDVYRASCSCSSVPSPPYFGVCQWCGKSPTLGINPVGFKHIKLDHCGRKIEEIPPTDWQVLVDEGQTVLSVFVDQGKPVQLSLIQPEDDDSMGDLWIERALADEFPNLKIQIGEWSQEDTEAIAPLIIK